MFNASTLPASIEPYTVPQPCREQRDADGRLISVTFELGSITQQVIHAARGAVLVVRAPVPPLEKTPC